MRLHRVGNSAKQHHDGQSDERTQQTEYQSIAIAVTGIVLFLPLLFALNKNEAAPKELVGYGLRNETLTGVANKKSCETEHAYTQKAALKYLEDGDPLDAGQSPNEETGDKLARAPADPPAAKPTTVTSRAESMNIEPLRGGVA